MEQLINFIIRPPRAEYNPKNDLLDKEFILKGKWYQRKDLEVVNSRGDVLKCSHYMPIIPPEEIKLPCVIYCHGNSGCRTDASEAAVILLPSNITIFTLDFSGSGLSGGEHVTLGWNEKDDLRAVVDYLRADGNVSLIGLWGRSMGAVTSLMYGAEDPSIAGMVLDSPFSDLVDLMMELVDTYKIRLPKFTVKFAIQYMRRAIQKKAKFDISDLNTIKVAKSCFVPVLFGHANDDDFIQPHHSDRIFGAYVGDKNIIKFEGDHNSPRPQFYFDSISIFFKNILQPPENEIGSTYFDLSHDYFNKDRWSLVDDVELPDSLLGSPAGQAANCSEDEIKNLRNKRPMSSIVAPADISSKDDQFDSRVENREPNLCPSSSNMISFELLKGSGSSSSPYVSQLKDDDEYIEYSLGPSTEFPTNVEEEERQISSYQPSVGAEKCKDEIQPPMFMEAVLLSLKDSEAGPVRAEAPSSNSEIDLRKPETAPTNDQNNSVSTQSNSMKTESIFSSAADEQKPAYDTSTCNHSLTNANTISQKDDHVTVIKNLTGNKGPPRPTGEEEMRQTTSHNDFDLADRTRVTVQVEKNPSSNIVDGLLRRWDLNFFWNR